MSHNFLKCKLRVIVSNTKCYYEVKKRYTSLSVHYQINTKQSIIVIIIFLNRSIFTSYLWLPDFTNAELFPAFLTLKWNCFKIQCTGAPKRFLLFPYNHLSPHQNPKKITKQVSVTVNEFCLFNYFMWMKIILTLLSSFFNQP